MGFRYAIIFTLIIIPTLMIHQIESRREVAVMFQEHHLANVLEKALDAATFEMIHETGVDDKGWLILDQEAAVEAFYQTLYYNFNVLDSYERKRLKSYVPLILVIDYDGVTAYGAKAYVDLAGDHVIDQVFHEKRYFSMADGHVFITFTLEDYYYVDDMAKNITLEGTYDQLAAIGAAPLFSKPETYVTGQKQRVITKVVESELKRINDHNDYAAIKGIHYDFKIPDTDQGMRTATLKGVGLLVSIQGMPMGSGHYNMFRVAGSSAVQVAQVLGYDDAGSLSYHRQGCPSPTGSLIEVFDSAKEAAKAGYRPHNDCH